MGVSPIPFPAHPHLKNRGGQQGVRARVRAAGKALEGDDRQTICPI